MIKVDKLTSNNSVIPVKASPRTYCIAYRGWVSDECTDNLFEMVIADKTTHFCSKHLAILGREIQRELLA